MRNRAFADDGEGENDPIDQGITSEQSRQNWYVGLVPLDRVLQGSRHSHKIWGL